MKKKVFLHTDIAVHADEVFWCRDLGLLTKAFQALGHEAWLVVHPANEATRKPKSATRDNPVIWASPEDVRSPSWWQNHKPDLVILGLWTRPKYDPIRRAALSATPRVIERADSDGMRTASCGFSTYAKRRFDYFRDRTNGWPAFVSIPISFFYSLASILGTPWIEARLAQTLRLLPAIAVETPHATTLWKRLAIRLGIDPEKFHCIPHSVQTDIFKPDPAVAKKKQIISVGRWDSYQKNLPLLLSFLAAFLNHHPDWFSLVVGSGLPKVSPHPRITFSAPLPAPQLALRMRESRFFFSSSRYESFGLSLAEALCCGCIPLGPPCLSSLKFFQSLAGLPAFMTDWQRLSTGRTPLTNNFLSPKVAHRASQLFSPANVAQQFLTVLKLLDGKGFAAQGSLKE